MSFSEDFGPKIMLSASWGQNLPRNSRRLFHGPAARARINQTVEIEFNSVRDAPQRAK